MSLLCNIDAQLQQLPHMIKQIIVRIACKKNPVSGQSCQKEGKSLWTLSFLKAQELSYSYHTLNGETPALDRVSFCLYRKEFLAIVGPSGCGKSTILSLIAGLLTPGSGGITFYGENGHQPGIGYMLQHDLFI